MQRMDRQGRVMLRVRVADPAKRDAVMAKLSALGFRTVATSRLSPALVEGYLPVSAVRSAAGVPGVRALIAQPKPMKNAGSVQSQAVALQKADLAQANGYDGTGIKIGVMSDSYDACGTDCPTTAADDIASGDLPAAGVTVLEEIAEGPGSDEGRAMLQLVHDVAPGSALGFASAFNGELDFANNILALRSKFGADLIVDDVFYFDEPYFSDGILAQAVDLVSNAGAAYFSSAGNNGLEAYGATYKPISFADAVAAEARGATNIKFEQIPAAVRPQSFHNFGTNAAPVLGNPITTAGTNILDLQWDEPFNLDKVATDYDFYVFDKDGNYIDPSDPNAPAQYTQDDNLATDQPYELAQLGATTVEGGSGVGNYQIVVGKVNNGPANRIRYVVLNGLAPSKYQTGASSFGHSTARGGMGVGAIYYALPDRPEGFSSPGPTTILFDTRGNRRRIPQIRFSPEIAAADGVDNTFFGFDADGDGYPNFFGTSAAAPDAAAVAALVLQAAGGPGTLRPTQLYNVLQSTATPVSYPNDPRKAYADAGPVTLRLNGDWTRWRNYFRLSADAGAATPIKSVSLDLTGTGFVFLSQSRFLVEDPSGPQRADITPTLSPDSTKLTLTFRQGSFPPGTSFYFGTGATSTARVSTQNHPYSFVGAKLSVTTEGGTTRSGTVKSTGVPQAVNAFTGAGLVNADAATRAVAPSGAKKLVRN